MQFDSTVIPLDSRRRLWTLERPGCTFSCDLERSRSGWMVWFSVNNQDVGGHRFDGLASATEWADRLMTELPNGVAGR